MEGPAVLVRDSTFPYTQLSSLCGSFTFSPIPLFSCVAFCQAGWPPEASCCCNLVCKIVPYRISQNSPGFFCLCLALFSALGLSYWHQFSQVHTCSNKSLTCGLEGWTQLLAGVGVSWSSSTLQGIHLQAQFKHFLFFLFLLIDQKDFELLPFRPLF